MERVPRYGHCTMPTLQGAPLYYATGTCATHVVKSWWQPFSGPLHNMGYVSVLDGEPAAVFCSASELLFAQQRGLCVLCVPGRRARGYAPASCFATPPPLEGPRHRQHGGPWNRGPPPGVATAPAAVWVSIRSPGKLCSAASGLWL